MTLDFFLHVKKSISRSVINQFMIFYSSYFNKSSIMNKDIIELLVSDSLLETLLIYIKKNTKNNKKTCSVLIFISLFFLLFL